MAWRDLFRWGRKSAYAYALAHELAGLFRSRSGRTVNSKTAIEVSTVFGCSRVIGHGMAQVPFKLMQESADGRRRAPAKDHPLYALMARRPNPWQTSFEFREMLSWHIELCGQAFVFVNRSVTGRILELIAFEPGSVTVKRADDMTLTYTVRAQNGSQRDFAAATIWHLRGPTWNGYEGLYVLQVAREAIGLAMAVEESQAALQKNGVRPSGVLSVEGKLADGQYEQLRAWIEKEQAGAGKTGVPLIMDRAAKWVATQMTGLDAETLATRKNQVEEVCRFFGVMPIMVGYSDKVATYASAEQMFLAHAVHCLSPRWTRFEQSADANLLTDEERAQGYYFDHVEEGMIRGAADATMKVIIGYVNGGVMTVNEGRAKLDLNPDDDPASDKLRIPVTTVQDPSADSSSTSSSSEGKSGADLPPQVVFQPGAFQLKTEIRSPDVKIENKVEPTPVSMTNHNHIETPAPVVTNHVHPAEVKTELVISEVKIVSMPSRESVSETERDGNGNISRVTQTEKDA